MMKESTKAVWRVNAGTGWKRPFLFAHAYFYLARTDMYVNLLLPLAKFIVFKLPRPAGKLLLSFVIPNYHSKILVTADAKKIVTLNEDVRIDDSIGEKVAPFEIARQILFEHPDHITSADCACRMYVKRKTGKCSSSEKYGINTCMAIGEPQASFLFEHSTLNPKRLSIEEALDRLDDFHKNGWIHTFWFKDALGYRSYAMCNCCGECCQGMLANNKLAPTAGYKNKMILPSGYTAKIDESKCKGCGTCVKICPFKARTLNASKGKSEIDYDKCHGCGVCIDACPNGALSLELYPKKGIPLDICKLKEQQAQLDRKSARR